MTIQTVDFYTSDKVKIIADYYPVTNSSKGLILVHMRPATRKSWEDFAQKAQAAGFQTLAPDLRGHGDSGGGDYQRFSDAEYQASIADLAAAVDYLKNQGATEISLGGASLGANLSLWYFADHPEIRAVVLLSPGLNYRGIKTIPLASKIPEKQKILFVGADDDAAGMGGESCEEIAGKLGVGEKICYFEGGHGTNLFASHADLSEKILDFLLRF